ncbi:MAG: agmatinase [Planctomycetota bacterium]
MNFLGLNDGENDYKSARVAILPIPYDMTSTYRKGADQGPRALLYASSQLEFYDDELDAEPYQLGITTLSPPLPLPTVPEEMVQAVTEAASRPLRDGKHLIGIGGEHSITLPLVTAVHNLDRGICVLQIDAHADLRSEYMGSPYNHACVMRRIMEKGIRIVPVGIRALCQEERDTMRENGISPVWAREIAQSHDWIERVVEQLGDRVYVTFDLDGLDPSVLPSTGTPVPGGLGFYAALDLLRRVGESRHVVAADLTELKPDPVNHHSEFLAATLAYKMISYFWYRG